MTRVKVSITRFAPSRESQADVLSIQSVSIEACNNGQSVSKPTLNPNSAAGLAQEPQLAKWVDRAGGSLLIAAGAGLATISR